MEKNKAIVKKKILVVDDQKINRSILRKLLSDDYVVLEAENGQVALDILEHTYGSISLILLDIVMPVMDGFTFLRETNKNPLLSHIPIIVVSQQDGKESELSALDLGATDFITKPYKPDIVKFRVNSLIRFYEAVAFATAIERDKTTTLYTREAFFSYAKQKLDASHEKDWSIICFSFMNLNQIADLLGDNSVENLLYDTSLKLRDATEPYDGVLGRVWNNSILILLPIKNLENYTNEIEEILSFINNYPLPIKIKIKAGFCSIDDPSLSVRTYCDRAKLALESTAISYYSTITKYDKVLDEKIKFDAKLTIDAEKALKTEQFKVYFQPKVDLSTGALLGSEVLVRWDHPEEGLLTPDKFIPIFERNGFITEIDLYVFEKACKHMKEWIDQGYPPLSTSVNLSRTDLLKQNLPELLIDCVNRFGLEVSLLHIEITESSFVDQIEQILEMMYKLRSLGFIIEMDDFGSGYSSLGMLSSAPLDIIKLDIQFLKNRRENKTDDAIFPLVSRLSNDLDLPVIVEGVETSEDVDYLTSHAFKYGQGYYFSKPVPAEEYEQILSNATFDATITFEKCLHQVSQGDLYNFINGLPFGIMFCSQDNRIEFTNDSFLFFLGEDNKHASLTDLLTVGSRNALLNLQSKYFSGDAVTNTPIPFELKDSARNAKNLLVYTNKVLVNDVIHWQISSLGRMSAENETKSMDELNAIINNMKAEANFDHLTHVYNRHHFENLVNTKLAETDKPCAFIYIDIDNFKEINDSSGHQKGDFVLDKFGKLLTTEFRNKDILARMGGDEFAIFVTDSPSPMLIKKRLQNICKTLNSELEITCSIGIALYPKHGKNFKDLYKAADQAMYSVKTNGKNNILIAN
ncbi:MAG: EAL domain-containing protein [Clostridiales bacterium]|nr:EAL domain-containing protein [Clostridiales bacterium]